MKSGKGLKNYTTTIKVEQTISEIEGILTKHKVTDIWKQYSEEGEVIGLNFIVQTAHGKLPFRLPANFTAVNQVLKNQKKDGKLSSISWDKINDMAQARRVAWRILLDWIDAQLALVELEMVKIEQVFLPYMYDSKTEKTLFETLQQQGFKNLLSSPEDREEAKIIDVVEED